MDWIMITIITAIVVLSLIGWKIYKDTPQEWVQERGKAAMGEKSIWFDYEDGLKEVEGRKRNTDFRFSPNEPVEKNFDVIAAFEEVERRSEELRELFPK